LTADDPTVAGLSLELLGFVWLGAFLGAFAVGTAGFAFALAATALWLHVLDPLRATLLVAACGTLLHIGVIWRIRRTIEPRRISPFIVSGLLGVPIGIYVLTRTDPHAIKIALGAFLIAYGVYALVTPRLPLITAGGRAADAAVGFVAGILGGIGGYSGVLPTIWTQLRGWPKDVARGVYQPFILVMQIATVLGAGFVTFDTFALALLGAALPALAAGAWLGWLAFGRLDERAFRQVLAAMIIASGATLVL
jgi:uncharacterized membrane protein YfcA